MDIILDTHILLWALTGDERLPIRAISLINDMNNKIYYSIASIWEIEIKHALGKMPISGQQLSKYCKDAGFKMIHIKESHVFNLKTLVREESAPKHNDPFDRIMLAQAKTEDYRFLTHDTLIPYYDEDCVISV